MATYVSPPRALTPSSMICFRAGDLLPALEQRASSNETGAVCRRDLRRYYWLLAVALEGAPAIRPEVWAELVARARLALTQPTAADDLAAAIFVCLGALPGWNALALFALADRLETAQRRGEPLDDPTRCGVRVGESGESGSGESLVRVRKAKRGGGGDG